MNLKNILKANQAPQGWNKFLIVIALFVAFATDMYAQNYYDVSLRERRMGNQIGVEIWAKATDANAPKIGNMSISVLYNTANLQPAAANGTPSYSMAATDSIHYDVNQAAPLPYVSITSGFSGVNGYSALSAQAANSNGTFVYQMDVSMNNLNPANGTVASTMGRGSFVGMLRFNIINHNTLTNNTLTGITLNTGNGIGSLSAFDVSGNDMTANFNLVANTPITIKGLTILNPNGPSEAVNRNKKYPSLDVDGYPLYFERSGLITPAIGNEYGTNVLAYSMQYSTNNGTTWSTDFMRVAESRLTLADHVTNNTDLALTANPNGGNHYTGEITTTSGNNAGYLITQGNGQQLPIVSNPGYGGTLRVIWNIDEFFAPRSEQALLRIQQLDQTGNNANIANRTRNANDPFDISDAPFVLSRLFFMQLNGVDGYLRTRDEYLNATELTVSAWINLNSINAGGEPGIVATGPGPANVNEEGAWTLYLHEGQFPAFRAREIIGGTGRGEDGSQYLATVISPFALTTTSDASPINLNEGHSDNWAHIAAVVRDNRVALFVNGELVAEKINTNAINIRMATYSHPIWVGVNPTGGLNAGDYLHAGIKEVQVWRKALTHDQMRPFTQGVANPSTVVGGPNDHRAALMHYYDFSGVATDAATNVQQNGTNPIYFYTSPLFGSNPFEIPAETYPYRPDRAHIRLTSPTTGSGVSNLNDAAYPVRWIAYGVGNNATGGTSDVAVEFSRDGGNSWALAIDNQVPGALINGVDVENAGVNWEPYNNATVAGAYNDLQALIPTASNYSKTVRLRVRGMAANNQSDISNTTGDFTVAPYFSLKSTGNGEIAVPAGTQMNLTGGAGMLEAWVRPYRFPTEAEGYFPIINKKDAATGNTHYALRLLNSGQLQFVVTTADGTVLTANSDATKPLDEPNATIMDSAWTHIAVFVNLANGSGSSAVKFYIDGNPQNASAIVDQFGANVAVNSTNTFPTYIMFEPGVAAQDNRYFFGEMKGVRYWNGVPGGVSIAGNEPTQLTSFIRGAAGVNANEILASHRENLVGAFDMNGGPFVASDRSRSSVFSVFSTADSLQAQILNADGLAYTGVQPYIKVVEPVFEQVVANTTEDLLVRWTGFNYDRNGFRTGDNALTQDSDLEYSVFGGGNTTTFTFNAVASDNTNALYTDALTLPLTENYRFLGTNPPHNQFAGSLNVSIAAEENNAQVPIPATNTRARLRLSGRSTINTLSAEEYTTYLRLRSAGPIFTLTPASNFTVRVLLEGYHLGRANTFTGVLGNSFETNGLRISLYSNNQGTPGNLIAQATSLSDFVSKNPLAPVQRTNNGSSFGNVPFVFTDIEDGNYFVLVEHQNHLPVLSRYAAPFAFSGDDSGTWSVESGWDFQGWNGVASNTLMSDAIYTTPGSTFTAFGFAESNSALTEYGSTGLRYNDGQTGAITNGISLAAMVGGDVVRDGKINAADRVRVRLDVAGAGGFSSDVTGDGIVNATDRQIVDRNDGIFYSLETVFPNLYATPAQEEEVGGGNGEGDNNEGDNNEGGEGDNNEGDNNEGGEGDEEELGGIIAAWEERIRTNDAMFANATNQTAPMASIKEGRVQAGGLDYEVTAETEIDEENGLIYLDMYIRNIGDKWAPANCTFAVNYNPNVLSYATILMSETRGSNDTTLWNANNNAYGYDLLYSAPTAATPNPIPDVRTIEIDYRNNQRLEGINVPYEKTKIGTLVFKIRGEANEFAFRWNRMSVVHTTSGIDATRFGKFRDIVPVNTARFANIIYPNGGEVLRAGSTHFITWTKPNVDSQLNIDFSANNGATWSRVNTAPVDAMTGSFEWRAPMLSTGEALIRLSDAATGVIYDMSDAIFSITPASNYIVKPATADQILVGNTTANIEWVVEDAQNLRFEFSADGISGWIPLALNIAASVNSIEWIVPANVNTKNAVIAMYDANTGAFLAKSEPFRVLAGTVTLTRPNAGEMLTGLEVKRVLWAYRNVVNFDLQLSVDGGATWESVSRFVNAVREQYDWTVKDGINSDNVILRAVWNNDNAMEYSRTATFSLRPANSSVEVDFAGEFNVSAPYPNPFALSTNVEFYLPAQEKVTVEVFNATGAKVASLINNETTNAGLNTLVFNSGTLTNGVYYIRFTAGENSVVKEVVIAK